MKEFIPRKTVYVHTGSISMSKSFNGLKQAIVDTLKREPKKEEVFVFFNTKRTKCKVLFHHINGFCIVYKALDDSYFVLEHKNKMRKIRGGLDVTHLIEHIETEKLIRV